MVLNNDLFGNNAPVAFVCLVVDFKFFYFYQSF